MRRFLTAAAVTAAVLVLTPALSAQWSPYTPSAVPKGPDGKPNLTAPPPRLPDGKIDLSGVWVNVGRGGRGRGQQPPAPPPDAPPAANFGNTGAGFKDGLPFQPWAAELQKKRASTNSKDNPDAQCLPMGFMQFHTHPQPRKMIHTPTTLAIIYEANYGLRTIYTDGRSLPPSDAQPFWYGYSVGTWEGDTLVVESRGFRDDGWLDVRGSPYTDQLKLTERFRRINYGSLEIDVTIDDPKAYTAPFTVRVTQRLTPDQELIEFICNENQMFDKYLRGDLKK